MDGIKAVCRDQLVAAGRSNGCENHDDSVSVFADGAKVPTDGIREAMVRTSAARQEAVARCYTFDCDGDDVQCMEMCWTFQNHGLDGPLPCDSIWADVGRPPQGEA